MDDTLWAYRTTYKIPIEMSPFKSVYGKTCNLLVEIEYKAFWAVKQCNLDMEKAREQRLLELQEPGEMKLETYENSRIYKEKTKVFHDNMIAKKLISAGPKVLLYNSRLKLQAGKFLSKWGEPFIITHVYPHGVVDIKNLDLEKSLKVNEHRLKISPPVVVYLESPILGIT